MSSNATESVGFLVNDLARLLRRQFDRALCQAGLGLSPAEARVLAYGARYPGLRQSDLAERLGIEPMSLVGFLDRLEQKGLVQRVPDPQDRRGKLVQLLPPAKPLVERIIEIARWSQDIATAGLDEADVSRMREALLLMRRNLAEAAREVVA